MHYRLVLSALLLTPLAPLAQAHAHSAEPDLSAQVQVLQDQLAEQRTLIDALAREVAAQRALVQAQQGAATDAGGSLAAPPSAGHPEQLPEAVPSDVLAHQRGTGNSTSADDAHDPMPASAGPPAGPAVAMAAAGTAPTPVPAAAAAAAEPARPAMAPVGKPAQRDSRPPEVAPLFEQPGVLTPKGKLVFEPSLQFGYSSSNRVALVGYTVIPALLIGLVDVREVKRNTTTASFSLRTGLTNRLEIEAKVPYIYRSDATVSREIFTGTAVENVFNTSGKAIGDAELGLRYQLNRGGPDSAYYIAGLRAKSRTGRDPFSVVTDCAQRCIGPNATGTGLPLNLPTGSGFYAVQPSLTMLFPSDPAVFFGSVSYLHNIKRKDVSRTVLGGEQELLGEVAPGSIIGFNFGMGIGLNDKASFSLGYDHNSIGRTRQNGVAVPGSVRTQLGTLLVGYSYRINEKRSLSVSVGAGLTRDTPDVSLTLRMPLSW